MRTRKDKNGALLSDAELVLRCAAGMSDAFGILMSRHRAALRRKIRSLGLSGAIADDMEQETWVRAYQRLQDLRDGDSFQAWLIQVAHTVCLAAPRKDQRKS